MDFGTIWIKINALMNSKFVIIAFILLFLIIGLIYQVFKAKKIKLLMADDRFKSAKLFDSDIESPIAISTDGYIGIVSPLSKTVIFQIKTIKEFEIQSDGKNIMSSGEVGTDGAIFQNAFSKAEQGLKKETKKINLKLNLYDASILDIPLFTSSKRAKEINDSTKDEIKQLLCTLEDVEKSIKKLS